MLPGQLLLTSLMHFCSQASLQSMALSCGLVFTMLCSLLLMLRVTVSLHSRFPQGNWLQISQFYTQSFHLSRPEATLWNYCLPLKT